MKKILTILFLFASLIGSSQTLQWFNSYPTAIDIPSIHLNDAYAAYDSYCVLEGNATVTNGVSVTERGIFWGNSSSVTYATRINKIVASSAGDGTFTVSQNILGRNSTYYVKAYAIYPSGVVESANYEVIDTDLDLSASHSSVTATTATVNLILNNPNNYYFTDRYVVVTGPSYAATITAGAGTTSVALSVTGLVASTTYTYSCRTIAPFCGTMTATSGTFTTISSCVAPTISLATISGITATTANTSLTITNTGGCTVLVSAIQWSVNSDFSGAVSSGSNTTGSYTITGLSPNTTYYVRGYAANSAGDTYTATQSFTTLPSCTLPTVTTASITTILATSATGGGNVTATGGCAVTARGVCWSTSTNPTISNSHTTDGSGTGSFTSNINSLAANTTYYVRAYATNSAGTGYGSTLSFTTLPACTLPTVTTASITAILATSATGGGNVTATGGCAVTARGVCWSTSTNPTISNSHTTDGSGTGSFTSNINSLAANTTYYVRSFATNSIGTGYGNTQSFTTLSNTLNVGDNYGGGIVAYIFQSGDPGYVSGQTHGIIAATSDQSSGIQWYNGSYVVTDATSEGVLGGGLSNTNKIVSVQGSGSYAAKLCYDLTLNGYSDWVLPNMGELRILYTNKSLIGGFSSANYWSSYEGTSMYAGLKSFKNGDEQTGNKSVNWIYVRAIRYF